MKKILLITLLTTFLFFILLASICCYNNVGNTTTKQASFLVSNLVIWPSEVQYIEDVTVSITVTNTGDIIGIYDAMLFVNGVADGEKSVAIEGGESKNITFYIHHEPYGIYYVSIDGLEGSFEVVEPWPYGE